jgi:hypothetical protein
MPPGDTNLAICTALFTYVLPLAHCYSFIFPSHKRRACFIHPHYFSDLSVDFDNGDRVVLIGSSKEVVYKGIVKLR